MAPLLTTTKGAAAFYWRCLKRAFSGKFAKAEGWTGGLSVMALVIAWITSPSAGDERTLLTVLPAAFFVGAFSLTVLLGIILAPFEIYRGELRAREAVEALRQPKVAISLPDTGTVNIETAGNTTESLAGSRQTVGWSFMTDVVCLYCKNVGEVPLRNCRARVLSASRVSDDDTAVLKFTESIELPWRKEDTSCLMVDLPPGETRRIWIGGVRTHGHFWVYRELKDLPLEAQQVFGPPGTYRIVVQVNSDDIAPVQVLLEVKADKGPKPEKAGLWRGTAEVAILAQGSPAVEMVMS
jgi:hypothetical protein